MCVRTKVVDWWRVVFVHFAQCDQSRVGAVGVHAGLARGRFPISRRCHADNVGKFDGKFVNEMINVLFELIELNVVLF